MYLRIVMHMFGGDVHKVTNGAIRSVIVTMVVVALNVQKEEALLSPSKPSIILFTMFLRMLLVDISIMELK